MTAGWDSRLALALARPWASDLRCYTLAYPQAAGSRDVRVPARLLRRLGLRHEVLRYPRDVDPRLRALAKQRVESGNDAYCADVQAIYERIEPGRVCVTGDAAEIVKCHFRREAPSAPPTPADLAQFCGMPPHPFALQAFGEWLADARPANLPIEDLFCWEQQAGRWQARIRAEYDLVQESFAPLNCRALLQTMLGVDETLRRRPDFLLLRELIAAAWPDTLQEPINPPERPGLRGRVLGAVRALARLRVLRLVPPALRRRAGRLLG